MRTGSGTGFEQGEVDMATAEKYREGEEGAFSKAGGWDCRGQKEGVRVVRGCRAREIRFYPVVFGVPGRCTDLFIMSTTLRHC